MAILQVVVTNNGNRQNLQPNNDESVELEEIAIPLFRKPSLNKDRPSFLENTNNESENGKNEQASDNPLQSTNFLYNLNDIEQKLKAIISSQKKDGINVFNRNPTWFLNKLYFGGDREVAVQIIFDEIEKITKHIEDSCLGLFIVNKFIAQLDSVDFKGSLTVFKKNVENLMAEITSNRLKNKQELDSYAVNLVRNQDPNSIELMKNILRINVKMLQLLHPKPNDQFTDENRQSLKTNLMKYRETFTEYEENKKLVLNNNMNAPNMLYGFNVIDNIIMGYWQIYKQSLNLFKEE